MDIRDIAAAQFAEQKKQALQRDREVSVTRDFAAPPQLVWQAITDPQQVASWWGPDGFTTTTHEHDLREGGSWKHTMHGPDGTDFPNHIVFDEIRQNSLLRFHHVASEGNEPVHHHSVFSLEEIPGGTRVNMRMSFSSNEFLRELIEKYGVLDGAVQCIRRWGEHVMAIEADRQGGFILATPSDTEILIMRSFQASPQLLYEATTQPRHLRNWWGGCQQLTTKLCEADPVVGGKWRIVLEAPDGSEHAFHGEYVELVPARRVVQTFVYEQVEGAESLESAEYLAIPGGTRLLVTVRHHSREARDAHLQSGMEGGMNQSHAALDRLLAQLQGIAVN